MLKALRRHGQETLELVGTDCRKATIQEPVKTYLIITEDQVLVNIDPGREVGNERKN